MPARIYKVFLIFYYVISLSKHLHTSWIRALKYVRADKLIREEIECKVKQRFPTIEDSDDPELK